MANKIRMENQVHGTFVTDAETLENCRFSFEGFSKEALLDYLYNFMGTEERDYSDCTYTEMLIILASFNCDSPF